MATAKKRARQKRPTAAPAAVGGVEKISGAAGFTFDELLTIMTHGAAVGVKTLQIGTLAVSFKESIPTRSAPTSRGAEVPPSQNELVRAEKLTREGRKTERAELSAAELERLAIEDPAKYERFLMSEDAADADDDERDADD